MPHFVCNQVNRCPNFSIVTSFIWCIGVHLRDIADICKKSYLNLENSYNFSHLSTPPRKISNIRLPLFDDKLKVYSFDILNLTRYMHPIRNYTHPLALDRTTNRWGVPVHPGGGKTDKGLFDHSHMDNNDFVLEIW